LLNQTTIIFDDFALTTDGLRVRCSNCARHIHAGIRSPI